ncbi:hypothetical protein [Sphingomonas sp. G-3-2-10]|uniref:hypothetical protein n=1 Tax=Sphingomonas sp. G-3-2-10 TaxID=2728838 RepID=UPI00146F3527|nr:hypothetical protein [Sphingomonas sp. G-3-2-10]NML04417.1 hypothetical protein [Sphingomonas sp. G-3-2-10]
MSGDRRCARASCLNLTVARQLVLAGEVVLVLLAARGPWVLPLSIVPPVLTALLLYRESSDRTLAAILLAMLIVPGMMSPELLAHALGTCLQ